MGPETMTAPSGSSLTGHTAETDKPDNNRNSSMKDKMISEEEDLRVRSETPSRRWSCQLELDAYR